MAAILDTTPVTDEELLTQVKQLNRYGDNPEFDNTLRLLIDDAKNFLRGADVAEVLVNSKAAVGVIAYYVEDISRREGISEFVINRTTKLKMESYKYE